MKITKRQLRKIIKEAIDSKIIQPNMSMRSVHHAHQYGAVPPEINIPNEEIRKKISSLRGIDGGDNTADSLVAGLEFDTKPLFGTGIEGETYGDIKDEHEFFIGKKEGLPAFYEDSVVGDSAYLEIMYPFSEIAFKSPELENTRLWEIMDDQYRRQTGDFFSNKDNRRFGHRAPGFSDPFRFFKDIKQYIEDPQHAKERNMLSQYQEFGWQYGFNSFEDFLMEKAERIKKYAQHELDSDYESY